MITTKDIRRHYREPIKTTFKHDIDKYISEPIVQSYIGKAMQYELSEQDRDWLWDNGQHGGHYPHLNYLCTIYIHPLTIAQNCIRIAAKIGA
uniref:Uncharacterized protein n=1 Tax=viral metagenome TaxID=1070528 RepID=A0A6M3LT51_9ZZZZ